MAAVAGILTDVELLQQQALLGEGYADLVDVENLIYSGLHLIVLATDDIVETNLLGAYNANLKTVYHVGTASLIRGATEALERHIENNSGMSFDDYLTFRSLKVTPDFAALSAIFGHPISPSNIGP
jgi:hypothetical protein